MNQENAAPRDHHITIELQGKKVKTTPDSLHVSSGDVVTWDCDGLKWAVSFGGRQPVKGPFEDEDPERRHNGKTNGTVRANPGTQAVRYKYAVAVYDGDDVYVADPEVIVDPDTQT
jgi:plastocyanin